MMDNIEKVLEIFFKRVSIERIITGKTCCYEIMEDEFVQLMRGYIYNYSDNELSNMYSYLTASFFTTYYAVDEIPDNRGGLNVFSLLQCYTRWILKLQGDEVVCEYKKLFHWRNAATQLSEDLLVASFLADREWKMSVCRSDFSWKPFITHNNEELKKIIKEGICENHYHLKGSAPVFQLTWVSLMNTLDSIEFEKRLSEIESDRRNYNVAYYSKYVETPFSLMISQAALIRLFLVSVLLNHHVKIGEYRDERLKDTSLSDDEYSRIFQLETEKNVLFYLNSPDDLLAIRGLIQSQIQALKTKSVIYSYPDYALGGISQRPDRCTPKDFVFQGERWFIYEMFKGIYGGSLTLKKYQNLFYGYLVIKENIRAELIQINGKVGFENFRIYQDRKEYFLESSFFQDELVRSAIRSSIFDSNVVTLEARITPKDSAKEMAEQIRKLDNLVMEETEENEKLFYTVHFIKTGSDKYNNELPVCCRHYRLRQISKKQALAIADLRERYPKEAKRIRGIDAANKEIGCGAEVFAQVFRFLSDHMRKREDMRDDKSVYVPQLRMTYHVGEDFLDIVSGLRAIDEAINYLNLSCGSRLGHALALGTDPQEWYASKNNRIILPQQEYLDNIAWLHHMLGVLRIPEENVLRDFLKKEFQYYFNLIYKQNIIQMDLAYVRDKAIEYYEESPLKKYFYSDMYDFSIENYYYAWNLRGDNPEVYSRGFFENGHDSLSICNEFAVYAVNKVFPKKQEIRYLPEVGLLYYLYHYNKDIRIEGEKCIEVRIKPFWIKIVQQIQTLMQQKITQYGIAIETNPTSNFHIGTFKRYEKHPIVQFYNRNLVLDQEKLEACPQMNVSINTDDQGIFNTSLENEYAYMALALENVKDENGNPVYKKSMIYNWLDDIRKMGIRQTFLSSEEIRKAFDSRRI